MKPTANDYEKASALAAAIEAELKRLNRWSEPLPETAFENMGAFGQNTMAFEQWIQFVLLDRLQTIIREQDEFPKGSSLAAYAARNFDGDPHSDVLYDLLNQLDNLVEGVSSPTTPQPEENPISLDSNSFSLYSDKLPEVVYALVEVLPLFEGDDLETQLQTFDMFLNMCSPVVRPQLADLLNKAAEKTENKISSERIKEAAASILNGDTAAKPYNHAEAMKKFQEEHNRNFPSQFKVD